MAGLDLPQDLIRTFEKKNNVNPKIVATILGNKRMETTKSKCNKKGNKGNQILATLSTWSQTAPGIFS